MPGGGAQRSHIFHVSDLSEQSSASFVADTWRGRTQGRLPRCRRMLAATVAAAAGGDGRRVNSNQLLEKSPGRVPAPGGLPSESLLALSSDPADELPGDTKPPSL
jgi:hypothetical protein